MAILVTGATGFIGTRLVKRLVDQGELVHALCRPTADTAALMHPNVTICHGDVTDAASVVRAMGGCSHVYHLAAYARNWAADPTTFTRVNVDGMRNVIVAARFHAVEKIVATSTSLTIPPSNGVASNELTPRQTPAFTEYGRSKVIAEAMALEEAQRGLPIVLVNPTRVFGPGTLNEANSATLIIKRYLEGTWRMMPGDGSATGNYVFVDDVVRGHIAAMRRGRGGERYILGGENATYREFFGRIAEVAGARRMLVPLPRGAAMTFARFEEWRGSTSGRYPMITPEWAALFFTNSACSTAKAESELGYRYTPLADALAITIRWLRYGRRLAEIAQ